MSNPFDDDGDSAGGGDILEGHDVRREIQFVREMNKSSGPGPVGKGFSVQMLKSDLTSLLK